MKSKKMWRYKCDFCGKWGGSKYHMTHHECRCTMNPSRECGVCAWKQRLWGDCIQRTMVELLTVIGDRAAFIKKSDEWGDTFDEDALGIVLGKLREFTDNCPACILAAFRQSNILLYGVGGFNFKSEMESVLSDLRADQGERDYARDYGGSTRG